MHLNSSCSAYQSVLGIYNNFNVTKVHHAGAVIKSQT